MSSLCSIIILKKGRLKRRVESMFSDLSARSVPVIAAWLAVANIATADNISYNNQIGPILSEHCFHCHGPDSAARKPSKHPLRLDKPEFAYEARDGGKPVLVKGDPAASEMIRRIEATDDDAMPPASEHNSLKPDEVRLLKEWISQGGKYEKHWSLLPPVRPAVPNDGGSWARGPIDHFVARKLAQNGLTPNSDEDKARLYRRLSFDLTGLPPSPSEVEEFVHSKSGKAYEKAVDKMLASDACAEQFTRWWLDAVRYADTQGIHLDFARSVWPYRDWVIDAYRTNMPFDQFSIQQIAGDMLPHANDGEKVASCYNRLIESTSEGGAIPDEYAAIYAKDRVETTAAVWLGLTAGCATCHDHKFDPISTKDFYSLTAFFRNTTSSILDGPNGNNAPTLFVPAKQDVKLAKELEKMMADNKKAIETRKKTAEPDYKKWVAEQQTKSEKLLGLKPFMELPLASRELLVGQMDGRHLEWAGTTNLTNGPFGLAPLVKGGDIVTNAAPVVPRSGVASYGAYIMVDGKPNGAVFSRMNNSDGYRGWDFWLTEGRPTIHIIDQFPDHALKITANNELKPGRWHHVMAVFDGSKKGADALALYVDGLKANVEVNNNNLGSNIFANVPFRLGGRSSKDGAADGISGGKVYLQNVRFYQAALTGKDVARLALEGLIRPSVFDTNSDLTEAYLVGYNRESQHLIAEGAALKEKYKPIRERGGMTLITEEKSDTKPSAYVLIRGTYTSKGDEVFPATPSSLPPMPTNAPRNRVGLAEWMMSRDNPLTARVTMNRLWAQIFGTGIVETTEDFGVMGARPSNQALLDWLAVEFMDSGWDFRHMVKTIVMSSTYRQSDAISPEKLEKDPLDKLLSRAPHLRLEAEEIRDQALAVSGLLVNKIGGPPVKPYQPEGVWEAVAMKESDTKIYKQDTGPSLYRRSLYTYWKRTAPPPNMEIMNAPTRESFCTRRERTDTPLQALVTLNDTQFIEAARHLAARAIVSNKSFDKRLDAITEPLMARDLRSDERAVMRKMEEDFQKKYQGDATDANSLLKVGESPADAKIAPAELAAWTLVASEVLNLDEALTK